LAAILDLCKLGTQEHILKNGTHAKLILRKIMLKKNLGAKIVYEKNETKK